MKNRIFAHILVATILSAVHCGAQPAPLDKAGVIELPQVEGRIDHMAYDPQGGRLFVAALGNNTVEVVDLKQAKVVHIIRGLANPQGIAFAPDLHKLFVANDKDGSCRVFDSQSYGQLTSIDLKDDADNVRYDAKTKRMYVGYASGAIGGFNAETFKSEFEVKLPAHPESFQLESKGNRIFVNLPQADGTIAVIDREKSAVVGTWKVREAKANFPMALDEANGRLLIGCRKPAKLAVLDTQTGKTVETLDCVGDTDDLWLDRAAGRAYVSGGEGSVSVFARGDGGHYQLLGRIPTAPGARTSFFVTDTRTLYVAVPHRGQQKAELLAYRASAMAAHADDQRGNLGLSPVPTVSLPQITGGTNHLAADAKRQRFFVTAPGEKKVVVVDLQAGKVLRVMTDVPARAACFVPDSDQLCLSGNGGVTFYKGDSLERIGRVELGGAVDELQYTQKDKRLYAGLMDAAKPGIAVIDVSARKLLTSIALPAKPQGSVVEQEGTRIYANTPGAKQVTVLDRRRQSIEENWKLDRAELNYPIALDEKNQRLFVGCRRPAKLLVLNTQTGKTVASVDTGGDADDMSFDQIGRRIYLACGTSAITSIQQIDADHYRKLPDILTADGARNSLFVPELKIFYLAVPHEGDTPAQLRAYRAQE